MSRSVVSVRAGSSAPPLTHRSAWKALMERHGIVGRDRLSVRAPAGMGSEGGGGQDRRQHAPPGNGAPIGGIKVSAASGWLAAQPSGAEGIYKIHVESFTGPQHLQRALAEAQATVDAAISTASGSGEG